MKKYNFDEIIDRNHTDAMNVEGFRTYIFNDPEKKKVFAYKDDEFIRMWVADMEFAVADEIIDGIKERLKQRIFGYTQLSRDSYFKAFDQWTESRYGWKFDKHDIFTSGGVVPAIFELVDYITNPYEKVLIMTPSFGQFANAAKFHNRELVCTDLVEKDMYYTVDFEDFERKASDPNTTLFIFCNPQNPTGRVWTEEELRKIGEICRKYDLYVISDEIHCDLIRKGQKHIPLVKVMPDYNKIITCMAPSKTFNVAGFMFSNIIIPNKKIRAIWQAKHYAYDNPLSIAAAEAAYAHGANWLDQLQDYLDGNFRYLKEFLAEKLPKAKFRIPEATYLAWVDIGAYLPKDTNLSEFFANKAGVLLEGGNASFVHNADSLIRLNLAMPRSELKKGMERIADALQKVER
ncbi:MAG: PatB family C-S lyase [Acidaminococcus sp.]|jgi:cystathionine beta-lyase|nr:PatB family C-S lyase [Acidaminococcus sp.]MCI2100650.1 PatB family C-S lyase [Acidaminococcus sp.]MCI2114970.1 PatB family C-S lyase [Acidaminococcus sp.]MCI2117010.1 PatB family C-S lyase [Acidaminococcus sp.]